MAAVTETATEDVGLPYVHIDDRGVVTLDTGEACAFVAPTEPLPATWEAEILCLYHHCLKLPRRAPTPTPATDPFALALEGAYVQALSTSFEVLSVVTVVASDASRATKAANYMAGITDGTVLSADRAMAFLASLVASERSQLRAPLGGKLTGYLRHREHRLRSAHIELAGDAPCYLAYLSLTGMPAETTTNALAALWRLPIPVAVAQSFAPIPRATAMDRLRRSTRRLRMTDNEASSLAAETDDALGQLLQGQLAFGDHALSLRVAAPSQADLRAALSEARAALGASGYAFREETLALPATHVWFHHRRSAAARSHCATAANFADLFGRPEAPPARASVWGDGLVWLQTRNGELTRFGLHTGDVGHTLVTGPTGEGKSVFLSTLATHARLHGVELFWIDKDRGARECVRALGGSYHELHEDSYLGPLFGVDEDSGSETPPRQRWLRGFLADMVPEAPAELLAEAVTALFELEPGQRSMRLVANFLAAAGASTSALEPWCPGGPYGPAFHGTEDHDESNPVLAYDFSHLQRSPIASVALSFLFLRFEQALRRSGKHLLLVDEAWMAFEDPTAANQLRDYARTLRKLGGALVLATQSPRDLGGELSAVVREQCATLIAFRSLGADETVAQAGFSAHDAPVIRGLARRREFLARQNNASTVYRFDLSAIPSFLRVFAGRERFDRVTETFHPPGGPRV